MNDSNTLFLGAGKEGPVYQLLRQSNRHGLIAGATGTGKTVTLQTLAENFSHAGVPVFMADVKGDLSGLAKAATRNEKIDNRIQSLGISNYSPRPCPVIFWDLYGKGGHPVRTTISDMGPLLLSNLLQLNDTQSGVLYACFKIADDQGLLLLDLKDLRALLSHISENSKALQKDYGNLSTTSVAAIQRSLLALEQQGVDHFFGEPALKLEDLMQSDFSGNGVISILDATQLLPQPQLYATFLLWLLAELFEQLPEVGDADKPRLVFFFDEAHLLFDNAPKALIDKIEQVVRLIRSKGVGIYFVSQSPLDIPEDVLGQLGHRIQHALRAFTPKDQKAVKTAAQTFRANKGFNVEEAITELGTGEALISVLDAKGSPTPVVRAMIRPPESRIGPLTVDEHKEHISRSPVKGRYDTAIDRESAYEILNKRATELLEQQGQKAASEPATGRGREPESIVGAMAKSAARAIGSQLGRQIVRGLLGSLLGGSSGKRRR